MKGLKDGSGYIFLSNVFLLAACMKITIITAQISKKNQKLLFLVVIISNPDKNAGNQLIMTSYLRHLIE